MSENGTKNDQEVLVFHVEGLEAYRSEKTPVIKIPSDLPQWKQELHKKKEKEKIEKHRAKMSKLFEESQTPEWKKPLIELHRRRKSEQSEKEEAERRKAEEEKQYFEALPAWKKQLIYKKRAKSAENLFGRCKQKNELNKSDISKCKAAEKTEHVQDQQSDDVNVGSDTGYNDDEDNNENEISDNEKEEEHTINDEAEASVDEIMKREGEGNIVNGEVEHDNTGDGDQTEDLGYTKCEGIDVNLKVVDNERKSENTESDEQLSNEENDNNEELPEETSENPGNDGNEEMIPGEEEKEDETECLENDNETEETCEQQVEERSELEENDNKDDQNKE